MDTEFEEIMVWGFGRINRDASIVSDSIMKLKAHGITVKSLKEGEHEIREKSIKMGEDSPSKLFIISAAVFGAAVIGVIVFFLLPEPDPQEVARKWAADNVDATGEEIAGFILESLGQEGPQGLALKELGGEWIEEGIEDHLVWHFSETVVGGRHSYHTVVATAKVAFQVDQPPISGSINASLPFRLIIDWDEVLRYRIILSDAGFDTKLGGA